MIDRTIWVGVALATLLWVVGIFASWCDTMRGVLDTIQVEKTYADWGPVSCGNWKCDEDQCCTRCVNLDTGEQSVRCRKRGG